MSIALENQRTYALVGTGGSGKTSLAEMLLFQAGIINRLGAIEEGTTALDYEPEEIKRRGSIQPGFATFDWKGFRHNLVDIPGDSNFSADMEWLLAAVDSERCTALYGVPTMFIAELNHPDFEKFDLSSLRTGIMAGSSCPPETMREAIDRMNLRELTICYGLTETSPVFTQTSADDDLEHKCETVGKRHPPVLVKIVDPETGEECGIGEPGELCCKGYNVMKGYYKMPEETAKVIDEEGYLHSGDLGMVDEDGYYRVTGRVKDMIIRGGENIYPLEVENFLLGMPGVLDAQVVGIPDKRLGEIVGAFIRTRPGYEDMTEDDVRAYAIPRIARYKVPKRVFFVDDFPMTPSMKVQKFKLREMAKELCGIDWC